MSLPDSIKELKDVTDHILCHTTCGEDKSCHSACPNSNWDEKRAQCMQYEEMVSCHKRCVGDHSCHASCPRLNHDLLNEVKEDSTNILKDIMDVLVV
jgi:NAD-dependent dihydropyrimidine dehydrogenase PreA subunit